MDLLSKNGRKYHGKETLLLPPKWRQTTLTVELELI